MNIRTHGARVAIATLVLMLFACGGGDENPPVTPPAPPAPPPAGTVIGPAGGTVTAGDATLIIPAGALSQNTTISVTSLSPGSGVPESATIKGLIFDFKPDGTTFSLPATLTLPMVGTPAANERAVVSFLDPATNRWVDVSSTVSGTQISASVSHFTPYAARHAIELVKLPLRQWGLWPTKSHPSWGFSMGPTVSGEQTIGEVRVPFLFGSANPTFEQDNGDTPALAMGEVFSSATGESFSAYVEAPSGDPGLPDSRSGGEAFLVQSQSFVKRAPDATMQVVLSAGFLAASDHNGRPIPSECNLGPENNWSDEEIVATCWPILSAVKFRAIAYQGASLDKAPHFFSVNGEARMYGFSGKWKFRAEPFADSLTPLWTEANFAATDLDGRNPRVVLLGPLVLDVDLSSIDVCPPATPAIFCGSREFTLFSFIRAESWNWRGRESGAAAYLRDPQNFGGTALRMTGLEATNNPLPLPAAAEPAPLPCASGPNPAAGVLQFTAEVFSTPEGMPRAQGILVTRTQGSSGAVNVIFSASDGTGLAGVDYTAAPSSVHFADGDTTPRAVELTVLPNTVEAANKIVNLTLSQPGGCAALGTPATAELRILNDDFAPVIRYTVGGAVTGLTGTGLVLENHHGLFLAIAENGPFTFTSLPSLSGTAYSVRVFNQPRNSAGFQTQTCTVANGTGTFANANVTNVLVTCVDL